MVIALQIPAADHQSLRIALAGLVAMNRAVMAGGGIPPLYASGVRYRRESPDRWQTCNLVLRLHYGDCEDLASWRAAELQQQGEQAIADVRRSGERLWHAFVIRANGAVEDPSRILGMRPRKR